MTIQKKMRAAMISLAGLCCCFAPAAGIKAETNTNVYTVEGAYEITIPAEVSVNSATNSGSLQIEGNLAAYYNLEIDVTSENGYQLANTANSSRKVSYQIQDSDKNITFSNEENTEEKKIDKKLALSVTGTPTVCGEYKDILTFTMTAEDKTPHTLTFDLNCEDSTANVDPKTLTVKQGSAYGDLPTPTRDGYTFLGWFTESTGGAQVTKDTLMGATDVTVYAQWKENMLTMVYYADGATTWYSYRTGNKNEPITNDIMDTVTVGYGTVYPKVYAGLTDASRLHKTGYNTNYKGVGLWKVGAKDSTNGITDDDAAVRKYAVNNVIYGSTVAQALGDSVLNNLKQGDVTVGLYPAYFANTYTITYHANADDAAGSTADSTHTYDVKASLTANGYTREGYKFKCWTANADGSGLTYQDKAEVMNLSATNGATVTLHAQWEKETTEEEASKAKAQSLDLWAEEETETETEAETEEQLTEDMQTEATTESDSEADEQITEAAEESSDAAAEAASETASEAAVEETQASGLEESAEDAQQEAPEMSEASAEEITAAEETIIEESAPEETVAEAQAEPAETEPAVQAEETETEPAAQAETAGTEETQEAVE